MCRTPAVHQVPGMILLLLSISSQRVLAVRNPLERRHCYKSHLFADSAKPLLINFLPCKIKSSVIVSLQPTRARRVSLGGWDDAV